jgi:hypothetical protein
MREELQMTIGEDFTLLAEIAAEMRREVRGSGRVLTGKQWTNALKEPTFRQLIRNGRREEALAQLRTVLGRGEQ